MKREKLLAKRADREHKEKCGKPIIFPTSERQEAEVIVSNASNSHNDQTKKKKKGEFSRFSLFRRFIQKKDKLDNVDLE